MTTGGGLLRDEGWNDAIKAVLFELERLENVGPTAKEEKEKKSDLMIAAARISKLRRKI